MLWFRRTRRSAVVLFALGFLLPSAGLAQQELELVPFGANWRYLDSGVEPGPGWAEPGFPDLTWPSGPAQLGYGEGDEATLLSFGGDPANKHVTTWFRHAFQVDDADTWESLRLFVQRDDGVAIYLNGELLRTDRMPWTGFDATTLSDGPSDGDEELELHGFDSGSSLLVTGLNVLAVELHQASVDSDDLSFDLQLIARRNPGVVRGPYLQPHSPTSVRVRWSTATMAQSVVRFGTTPGTLTNQVSSTQPSQDHSLLLTGLDPDTEYFYDLGVVLGEPLPGRDFRFQTPPLPQDPGPSRLWVIGDSGTANTAARSVRDGFEAAEGPDPGLWVLLGDNAYPEGDDAAFQRALFEMYPEQLCRFPMVSVRGNHEEDEALYYDLFDLPTMGTMGGLASGSEAYFSMDWGPAHLVFLDSFATSRAVGDPMYTWLEADLAAADSEWLIAFWHHPPYSEGTHPSDEVQAQIEMRENFLPLLEGAGVDLVMAGHSHGYERSYLIDGHYGLSSTFDASMLFDGGDGRIDGDGAYGKARGPRNGTVYSVAGCAGDVRPSDYDHPVMFVSGPILGTVVLDLEGDRLDYTFLGTDGLAADSFSLLHDTWIQPYCEPSVHTGGCAATISWEGSPSVSGASPFLIHADQVLAGMNGVFVYGVAPGELPLFEGSLCVAPPFKRRPPVNAGGSGPCGGRLTEDFGALMLSLSDPSLQAGETIFGQFWYRDPAAPTGANLSQALGFVLQP